MAESDRKSPGFDLLRLDDLTATQIQTILERAVELAGYWSARTMPQSLAGKRIGLLVEESGWRNTTALSLGVQAMRGICQTVSASLSGKEAIADLARYFDNWFDLVAVRTPSLANLEALAAAMTAPVMNLRTRENHPCETLGDLAFLLCERGSIEGERVAVISPRSNILGSWVEAAAVLPLTVTQVFDPAYVLPEGKGLVRCCADMSVLADATLIVTDCWPQERDAFRRFQVTAEILDATGPDCLFIPCPPVSRGQELTQAAIDHPKHVSYQAKAFLLHAQNAFLEFALGEA
ncbi:MAG: ornithine carbamoyltransferase [Rhodospirillales bacterium]